MIVLNMHYICDVNVNNEMPCNWRRDVRVIQYSSSNTPTWHEVGTLNNFIQLFLAKLIHHSGWARDLSESLQGAAQSSQVGHIGPLHSLA